MLNGFVVFRRNIFRPDQPAFDCLTVGALLAGMLTLIRLSRHGQALALVAVYGAFRSLAPYGRWTHAISGLLLGLGVFLAAVIYDELAKYGLRFGKFLIVGPLVGGAYLAVAPITELRDMTVFNAVYLLLFQLALGIVIGEGVGLGVELVELLSGRATRRSSGATRQESVGDG